MQKLLRRRLLKLGISAASIGGALLAIYGVRAPIEQVFPRLSPYFTPALWFGLAVTAVGVLLILVAWLAPDPRPSKRFDLRRARPVDLTLIHDLGEELYEGPVSDVIKMRAWYDLNARIFYVVERVHSRPGRSEREIVGYYCVLPLKDSAAGLVEVGQLKGTDFTSDHIAQPHVPYRFIYIGGVAASGRMAQGNTLNFLKARITEETERGVEVAYTRPVTADGLRVAVQHGFHPVESPPPANPMGRIHALQLA